MRFVPMSCTDEFLTHPIFNLYGRYIFLDRSIGKEAKIFILQRTHPLNVLSLVKNIWDPDNLMACIRHPAFEYFSLSWKLLQRFPPTSSVFWNWRLHETCMNFIEARTDVFQYRPVLPSLAKLLAFFTEAYFRENEGKSSFFMGSYVQGLLNSLRRLQIPRLFEQSKMGNDGGPGKNGHFHLLKALAAVSREFAALVLAQLSAQTGGFLWQRAPHAQRAAAEMVAKAASRADPACAVAVVLRELEKVARRPTFAAAEPLCDFLAAAAASPGAETLPRIAAAADALIRNAADAWFLTAGVRRLLLFVAACGEGDVAAWQQAAARLLAQSIRGAAPGALRSEVSAALSFLATLREAFGAEIPAISVAPELAAAALDAVRGATTDDGKDAAAILAAILAQ
jgi:hypothetical protein